LVAEPPDTSPPGEDAPDAPPETPVDPAVAARSRRAAVFAAAALGVAALVAVAVRLGVVDVSPDSGVTRSAPTTVLHLRSEPAGAVVRQAERVVCDATPCDLPWEPRRLGEPTVFDFSHPGFLPQEVVRAVHTGEVTVSATLLPAP